MCKLHFTKMHGTGNDYVYVNLFTEQVDDASKLAVFVSDRHFGIGSDGLILIAPSKTADCRMIMYNADGSEGAMCGNGIRCVAKYAYEHGIVHSDEITIETKSGIKALKLTVENGLVTYITVNMGQAVLEPAKIPVSADGDTFVARKLVVDGKEYEATCVSMGNPHCVIPAETIDREKVCKLGKKIAESNMFKNGINVMLLQVEDKNNLNIEIFERGAGYILASGTCSCAAAAVAYKKGWVGQDVMVHMPGGKLWIQIDENWNLKMTGSVESIGSVKLTKEFEKKLGF